MKPVKFGEALTGNTEPSPWITLREGVETRSAGTLLKGKGIVRTTNPDILSGAAKVVVVSITRRSWVQIPTPLPNFAKQNLVLNEHNEAINRSLIAK